MNSFNYYSAGDFLTGVLLNAKVNQVYNLSLYNKDSVVPDYDPNGSRSTYNGSSAIPSPARTWAVHGLSLSTYYAGENTSITAKAAAIGITYQTSPNGTFAKHYIDNVNTESVSTYGPIGGTVTAIIPLGNQQNQTVKIVHSGWYDKRGNVVGPVLNVVGTSMASNVQLTPNGTPIVSDTWTLTGVNGTQFSLKRNSTGATVTLTYGTIYTSIRGNPADNGIPGFTLVVNLGPAAGSSATIQMTAPVLTIQGYTVYKNTVRLSGWQTPMQDSADEETIWSNISAEIPNASQSTYPSLIEVGNSLPPDATWNSYVPREIAAIDLNPTQYEQGYRQIIADAGQLTGRYCRVTFVMNDQNQFIRYPQIFNWDPNTEAIFSLIPPVVRGTNINKLLAGILTTFTTIQQKIIRLRNSMAASTAEQEYLVAIGMSLGFPMTKNETIANYRQRLALTIGLAWNSNTIDLVLAIIQAYANSTAIYIVQPNASSTQWRLSTSILGVDTWLGAKTFRYWQIEIHTPGAITNLVPDSYERFVRSLLPIGCVPVFIYE